MEVQFRTKNESNQEQERNFLELTPVERIYRFLDLMQRINRFPTKAKHDENTFIIHIYTGKWGNGKRMSTFFGNDQQKKLEKSISSNGHGLGFLSKTFYRNSLKLNWFCLAQ